MMRVFLGIRSAANTPWPCTADRRRTILGSLSSRFMGRFDRNLLFFVVSASAGLSTVRFSSRYACAVRRLLWLGPATVVLAIAAV